MNSRRMEMSDFDGVNKLDFELCEYNRHIGNPFLKVRYAGVSRSSFTAWLIRYKCFVVEYNKSIIGYAVCKPLIIKSKEQLKHSYFIINRFIIGKEYRKASADNGLSASSALCNEISNYAYNHDYDAVMIKCQASNSMLIEQLESSNFKSNNEVTLIKKIKRIL